MSGPDAQREWAALLAAFGAMTDALGGNPADAVAALERFGCNSHMVSAVAAEYRRQHGEVARWPTARRGVRVARSPTDSPAAEARSTTTTP